MQGYNTCQPVIALCNLQVPALTDCGVTPDQDIGGPAIPSALKYQASP